MVQPGTVLGGKYQVERVLGQGGMGCVVSALHLQLGQRVAIKFLLPEALRVREAVERFLREARAAVRLRSQHVGRVIDVGQFDDGAPYMVMEFLEGMDLSGYLQHQGPLPVAGAVDFVLQACEAIGEAHSIGIVHRDLKPANLFLTRSADGGALVKVLDFGISKASQGDQSFNLTRTTSIMGSPGYMSPEQLRSAKDCDARTDIWALGVILFELTTGRQPFGGDTITELALKVAIDPTPPMNLSQGPAAFEAVVDRCLAKDPNDRYQNVAELAAALAPFGPPSAVEAAMRVARVLQINPASLQIANAPTRYATATPIPGVSGAPTTLSSAAGTYGPGTGVAKSRSGLIAGLVAVALAGVVIAAVVVTRGGGSSTTHAPAKGAAAGEHPAPAVPPPQVANPTDPTATPPTPTTTEPTVPTPSASVDAGVAAKEPVAKEPVAKPDHKSKKPRKPRHPTTTTSPPGDEDLSDSRY